VDVGADPSRVQGMSETFAHVREDMEQMGRIYRKIQEVYGNRVSIVYLDPRNHFSIAGYLIRQWKTRKIGVSDLFKSVFFGIRRGAVFYNGKWLNQDQLTEVDVILRRIELVREKGD
jgi:hypothetical protein